jgi:glutaconate CoA-transferase, subunit B
MNAQPYTTADMMTCIMSRLLHDKETVFHGVSSHMPMVAMMLAKQLQAPSLVHLTIPGGVNPSSLKHSSYSSAGAELLRGAESMFKLEDIFDLSMRGKLDVAFLGGVQFDQYARVNASIIGSAEKPKVRLPGGAGSAVLIPTAKKAIIWRSRHDIRTFVKEVDFVTTKGNVWKIITPLCVFGVKDGRLQLESIHPGVTFEDVQKNTEFTLKETGQRTPEPTAEELRLLNKIDPKKLRAVEF